MFLDLLRRRNPALVDAAVGLHQSAQLPANTYVLDLDTITENARAIAAAASPLGLTVFAMTKQVGRNPDFCRAVLAGGITASVNVDLEDARATSRAGMRIGHLGHLVQIPWAEAAAAAALRPDNWTVFSRDKAVEAARAARRNGHEQRLLARIQAPEDEFYPGHEGGFPAADIGRVADDLDDLDGAAFAGITTFPALLFDHDRRTVRPTRNAQTLAWAADELRGRGRSGIRVNAPGTTSASTLPVLAEIGATQVEPGHALTGTTPWHAVEDLPERPAICYLSEISHRHAGRGYFFGGGLYVDPVFAAYPIRAVVGREGAAATTRAATFPDRTAIDYYGQLDGGAVGDSVVLGFRAQAFVTRAYTAGISGISTGSPRITGIWSAAGAATDWPT
ncbi:alanine racemase [Pseudonocardia sp. MH-G8]|uniref:alanine racemase n=1 Tax=Pseudonocardia sp. MH-G8 TaxID=1854588 RepID=UPI000BA0A249|nr:alanine racemase [Pseudonocardia sp. MH-G8]OZM75462.1 amino-acid racemase [Pseudonocardia sp. MH-G8]